MRDGVKGSPRFLENHPLYCVKISDLQDHGMLILGGGFVWKFIEAIQRQQSLQSFSFAQMQLGKKVHTRKEDNFGRIKRIVCSAANYKAFDYLKAIAVNLSF